MPCIYERYRALHNIRLFWPVSSETGSQFYRTGWPIWANSAVKATEDSQETNLTTKDTSSNANEGTNKYIPNPQLVELGLDVLQAMDENGTVPIPEDGTLLNIRIPEKIGETELFAIGPNAFDGITCLRSITIPSTITQIGTEAFVNLD